MSTITLRASKGSPLTNTEVDTNFSNLNNDKYESGNNVSVGTLTASGNVTFENLEAWQSSKVDVISPSGLHRATAPLDLTCIFEGV